MCCEYSDSSLDNERLSEQAGNCKRSKADQLLDEGDDAVGTVGELMEPECQGELCRTDWKPVKDTTKS
jgi:hypothetical protein